MFQRKDFRLEIMKHQIIMATHFPLIDPQATEETKALFQNLLKLSEDHVLFGHQHATEYGHGWFGDSDRSDVHSVSGSHPAVIGVDINGLSGRSRENIAKNKESLRENIVATYDRGGLTTLSWHLDNPVSGDDFNWKEGKSAPAVGNLIPSGSHHEQYQAILADIADLAHSVVGKDGTLAPMIFRPFHEFDGNWFWWGKPHCTREEFITLWQFTVSHLRDTLGVHNLIYAFSPDCLFQSLKPNTWNAIRVMRGSIWWAWMIMQILAGTGSMTWMRVFENSRSFRTMPRKREN